MKLRNKKTGEAVYVDFRIPLCNNDETLGSYSVTSLKELNKSFEDYEPSEPIIKDKKIRKAIRAWYDALPIEDLYYKKILFSKGFFCVGIYRIDCGNYGAIKDIKERFYSIKELCGDDEE